MRRARGVALITVLLVVAIATLAATALLSSASLAIHRTASLRDSEQAWWVARGVDAWVLGILESDRRDSQYDGLDEDWALPVDGLPVDQGFITGRIEDLQGRLNLNSLSPKNPKSLEQFRRLLRALPDLDAPPGLVDAIVDWSDADQQPSSMNGAEDGEYLTLDPPYRTANRPFTVVSELLAVRGMTPKLYQALQPSLAALPADSGGRATPINVNTAGEPVLRALADEVDDAKLRAWLEVRKEKPVRDAAGLDALVRDGPWLGAEVKDQLTWRSRYFQIQGQVFVGSSRVALYSLIQRQENQAPVVLAHSAEAE
ncbi:MAG: type II secretion system minor pseudopilin GspK [Gammaproteobacteria bacterium]